ncbi:imidazolonepropionase [Candidatus Eisenbacteria bacterium]|uniref:Imidazolonepropionase n=1 Tax=Eiseniibacteriota bacterium TaxID=2212470 RepID=A0ABV6YQ35_UNCEI
MPHSEDLLIRNALQVVTCEPALFDSKDEGGRPLGLIDDASILISAGAVKWVGKTSDLGEKASGISRVIDASGKVVLPGLVDAHTHTVFAGTREREYEMRIMGVDYMEIARSGGGINSTVASVREASIDHLVDLGLARLKSMLRRGTTTVEIKSGYGLDTETELKMLRAIREIGLRSEADVVPTFLGAHEFPPELKDNRDRYVDIVIEEMIPAVGRESLAEFCDVFCEKGVFTADQARRILLKGKDHGLKAMIHADEFADSGAADVAAEVGAVSAAHLAFASQDGLRAMREAGTVAIVLPGVSVGVGKCDFADARRMIEMGIDVAVGTDFNPGSSMVDSLLIVSSLACSFMKLTPAEAILGITKHAARAIDRGDSIGAVAPGMQADLVLFEAPDFRYVPYHFGGDIVHAVIKKGKTVFSKAQDGLADGRNSGTETEH